MLDASAQAAVPAMRISAAVRSVPRRLVRRTMTELPALPRMDPTAYAVDAHAYSASPPMSATTEGSTVAVMKNPKAGATVHRMTAMAGVECGASSSAPHEGVGASVASSGGWWVVIERWLANAASTARSRVQLRGSTTRGPAP